MNGADSRAGEGVCPTRVGFSPASSDLRGGQTREDKGSRLSSYQLLPLLP
jgi:hypothetical protein